jgi:hypothetical protein
MGFSDQNTVRMCFLHAQHYELSSIFLLLPQFSLNNNHTAMAINVIKLEKLKLIKNNGKPL